MVLRRKREKPLDNALSYRPICLLDTMGKLLKELILQRSQSHVEGENNLSKNHFSFRKGKSTLDKIRVVVDLNKKARRATCKRKRFIAIVSIDIRNAFNTVK